MQLGLESLAAWLRCISANDHAAIFRLPFVETYQISAILATYLSGRKARFLFLQYERFLRVREPRCFHRDPLLPARIISRKNLPPSDPTLGSTSQVDGLYSILEEFVGLRSAGGLVRDFCRWPRLCEKSSRDMIRL